MPVLEVLHRLRWPLGISIAALVAIFGGTVLGDQASQDIAPFYANVVVPQARATHAERVAQAPPADAGDSAGNSVVAPVDLSYASAAASATDDTAEPAR